MSGTVEAVARCARAATDAARATTGIERPVDSLSLAPGGVVGDVVADPRHHGGRDKAVYAYAAEDLSAWAEELDADLGPGWAGENLLLAGLGVSGALVGERWRVGPDAVVEVTMPRTPCAKFQRKVGLDGWVARFARAGRPGAYLRVLRPGDVRPGNTVTVEHRPDHGVGLARWQVHQDPADARALLAAGEAGLDLAPALLAYVRTAAGRA